MSDPRGNLPSASTMKRTRRCPGWLNLSLSLPDNERNTASVDGDVGTSRHSLIEIEADADTLEGNEAYVVGQSQRLADKAIADAGLTGDDVKRVREQRYWLYDDEPERVCSGQLDDLVYREGEFGLVLDYKTLFGNHGSAHENEQLATQVVLAADIHSLKHVRAALIQPNLAEDKRLTLVEFGESDIRRARINILNWCYAAMSPDAPRIPGPVQCSYCPCRARCPEAIAAQVAIVVQSPSELSTPENIAWLLDRANQAEQVVNAIRDRAKAMLATGIEIPGWRLKEGGEQRKITDPARLAHVLMSAGATPEEVTAIAKIGLTDADKLYKEKTGLSGAKAKEEMNQKLAVAGALEIKKKAPSLEKA